MNVGFCLVNQDFCFSLKRKVICGKHTPRMYTDFTIYIKNNQLRKQKFEMDNKAFSQHLLFIFCINLTFNFNFCINDREYLL